MHLEPEALLVAILELVMKEEVHRCPGVPSPCLSSSRREICGEWVKHQLQLGIAGGADDVKRGVWSLLCPETQQIWPVGVQGEPERVGGHVREVQALDAWAGAPLRAVDL